jgi:hypothetical protein
MKLQHHITGTILLIAFASTTALPAATIPQLKNPPKAVAKVPTVPAASRVPVVNIPTPPKVTTVKVPAVKVPAIAKIPALKTPVPPKVPGIAKIPAVKVPSVPKTVAAPAVKVPAAVRIPKVPAATGKMTATTKAPALVKGIANAPAANINSSKLKNLKERLPVEMKAVETRTLVADGVRTKVGSSGKGDRFMNDNFGGARPNQPGTFMEGVRSKSGGHDKNPLSSIPTGGGMITTRGGAASDDPAGGEDTSVVDAVVNWAMSVLGTGVGGPGTQSGAGTAASGTAGSFASTAFGILTANTGSVDDKKNEAEGIFGIFRQGATGTSNVNAASQLNQIEYQEPVPDDVGSSGSGIVTKGDIKGLEARKNQHSQPTGEESGSGGHVNTGANGAGKLGSLVQPAGDEVRSAVRVTGEDMRAMQVRINSRINTGGR